MYIKKIKKKKKKNSDLPTLIFFGLKPETNLFFFWPYVFKSEIKLKIELASQVSNPLIGSLLSFPFGFETYELLV